MTTTSPVLALVCFIAACGSPRGHSTSEPIPPGAHRPVKGADGLYVQCEVLHEGFCYRSETDACAAAGCGPGLCTVLESYPGQVECRDAAPKSSKSAPATAVPGDAATAPIVIESAVAEKLNDEYGKRVEVTGIYKVKPVHSKRGEVIANWPVVVLGDETEVMLESFWKHTDGRSPDERPDFVGKRVRAVGVLWSAPPKDEGFQNLAARTIAPVETLELVEPVK